MRKKVIIIVGIVVMLIVVGGVIYKNNSLSTIRGDKTKLHTSIEYHTRNVAYQEEHTNTKEATVLAKNYQADIDKYKTVFLASKKIYDDRNATQTEIDKAIKDLDVAEDMLNKSPTMPNETVVSQPTVPSAPTIGMTTNEVLNSTWGNPQKKNKTTTKYGISEQWVYSDYRYVYLDNGIVTSIQSH